MRCALGVLHRFGLRSVQVVPDGARDCTYPVTGQLHHQPHYPWPSPTEWEFGFASRRVWAFSRKQKSPAPSGSRFHIHWTPSSNPRCQTDGAIPILYSLVRCENMQIYIKDKLTPRRF